MAWRSSGRTHAELISNLFSSSQLPSPRLRDAMLAIDRAHYTPPTALPTDSYADRPLPLGHGATISAPHMHAAALAALEERLVPGASVLDVGSGSGYLTCVMAELVGARGRVVGVEHVPALVGMAVENTRRSRAGRDWLASGRVRFEVADGRKQVTGGPWDVIHVGACAEEADLGGLEEQLARPGTMFVPVRDRGGEQWVWTVRKDGDGLVTRERGVGVRYVPLCDRPETG